MSPTLELCIASVVAACVAAMAARWWFARLPVIRRRVLIPLRDPADHAVRGVVLRVRGPWVILGDVVLVRPGAVEVRMPGDVVIHQRNAVLFQAEPDA